MKKLILSLFFLSAFTLRGSAQLQGLEVVKNIAPIKTISRPTITNLTKGQRL